MPKIRTRLESYVVRNTADIVDELSDDRREELAEVLHDLEGHSPRAEEAERRTEELVEKLEHRNIVIAKSRARIEELERDLAQAKAEIGDREERIVEQIEAERIRVAEREQAFRSELEGREAEINRRLSVFDVREQELHHAGRALSERERSLSVREAGVENRSRELESRSDERLKARQEALDEREAGLERAERLAATEKQSVERRAAEAAQLERRAALRADSFAEWEAKLVADAALLEQRSAQLTELEQQLERRRADVTAYVARVQSTLPFQP
jgi:DNA repair exonuclease SbcCD ATPase subunit